MIHSCTHSRYAALIVVSALLSTALMIPAARAADQNPAVGKQEAQSFEGEVLVSVKLNYLLYLPRDYDKKESWPLLIFLHGSGESGTDLEKVKIHGPPKLIAQGHDFPFIVVSPQSARRGWYAPALNGLLDDLSGKYKVDKDRIYITGLSMGGYGTWSMAEAYPNKLAAIAPICGGGEPSDAPKIKNLPMWVFHGAKDEAVPLRRSEEMITALKEVGAPDVNFTIYPEAGHDSWTATYDNPEFYTWLLKQRRPPSAATSKP